MEVKIHRLAEDIQNSICETQEDMDNTIYYGRSNDNKVKVAIKGSFDLNEIKIDPNILNPESKETLEKDIIEAVNSAIYSSQLDYQASLIELMKKFKFLGF